MIRYVSRISTRGKVVAAVLLVAGCVIAAGALTYRSITGLQEASDWTDHTYVVLLTLAELETQLDELETNQRGFLLTGNPAYIEPNDKLEQGITKNVAALGALVADNPAQRPGIDRLHALVPRRIQLMHDTRELFAREGQAYIIAQARISTPGRSLMLDIHAAFEDLGREEKRLLVLRRAEEESQRHDYNVIIVTGAVLTFLFLIFIGFLVRSDLAARRQLRENAGRYALRDALTGLLNRPAFVERLEAALSRGTRHRRSLAVLCFELDGFAEVRSKFGKIASDQLLHQASKRVKDILRGSDVLARVADLRFLALVDETVDRGDAATKAANIIEMVGQPFALQGGSGSVFTSVGISLFPDDDTRSGQLIQFAEAAMDKARQAGRGKFRFFSRREMESA